MENNTVYTKGVELGERALTEVDNVVQLENLAKTKGFLIGAAFVGGCWLATGLYKKYKSRKVETEVKESEEDLVH